MFFIGYDDILLPVKRWLKIWGLGVPRAALIAFEVLVALAVMLALVVTYGLMTLARGPIDVSFAKTYLEEALSGRDAKVQVSIDRAALSWPTPSGPFQLDLNRLVIKDGPQTVASVRDVSITVARWPLLIGQVRPIRLIARAPIVSLERSIDRRWRLSWVGDRTVDLEAPSEGSSATASSVLAPFMGGPSGGPLSSIDELEIRQARVRVSDQALGMTWSINNVNVVFRAVDVGYLAEIDVALPNQQSFRATLTYQYEQDRMILDAAFKNFSFTTFAGRLLGIPRLHKQYLPLTGTLRAEGSVRTPGLDQLAIQATGDKGVLNIEDTLGLTLPVENLTIAVDIQNQGQVLVPQLNMNVAGIDVSSEISLIPEPGGYQGAMTIKIPKVTLDQISDLWPVALRDTPAAEWMLHKLSLATLRDVVATVPMVVQKQPGRLSFATAEPVATFAFEKLTADYLPPLDKVTQARGHGTYRGDALAIKIESGLVRGLTLNPSSVIMSDLSKKGAGHADLDIHLSGPLANVLAYIESPPISLGGKIDAPLDQIKGTGTYHAVVSFPTLKDLPKDQVKASVTATLNDLTIPGMVKGQALAGGPYTLAANDGFIHLKGQGSLGGRPLTLDWREPVAGPGDGACVTANAVVDTDRAFRMAIAPALDFMDGSAPITVDYQDCGKGRETVKLMADLTPTRINMVPLRFEKSPGLKAETSMTLALKDGIPTQASEWAIKAPGLVATRGTMRFGRLGGQDNLLALDVPTFTWGTSQGTLSYRRTAKGMDVTIKGKRLDLSPYLSTQSKSTIDVPPFTLAADVDALGFGGRTDLTSARLRVMMDAASDIDQLSLAGQADGQPASIQYVPDVQGRMSLNVSAADAGAFLRVVNVYDNMQGGTLNLVATPIGANNRDVKGNLVIKDFSVTRAPVLAQLLGALSIKGLGEQLGNQGIGFSRLESGFALLRRSGQDIMSFRDGRTSGSALGLTFDGIYDRGRGTIDLQGTIIPVSGLNTFASKIPLVGRLLTGGKDDALFAATYGVKGPANNPKTTINPLSVLAPGILRKMFFDDASAAAPDNDEPKGPAYND